MKFVDSWEYCGFPYLFADFCWKLGEECELVGGLLEWFAEGGFDRGDAVMSSGVNGGRVFAVRCRIDVEACGLVADCFGGLYVGRRCRGRHGEEVDRATGCRLGDVMVTSRTCVHPFSCADNYFVSFRNSIYEYVGTIRQASSSPLRWSSSIVALSLSQSQESNPDQSWNKNNRSQPNGDKSMYQKERLTTNRK